MLQRDLKDMIHVVFKGLERTQNRRSGETDVAIDFSNRSLFSPEDFKSSVENANTPVSGGTDMAKSVREVLTAKLPEGFPKTFKGITFEESGVTITAAKGDITQYKGDAVVNAANVMLAAGGGVCGAIFSASDFDALDKACEELGACPTGEARVTPSFGMPATWIVHAVGPVWKDGQNNEAELLSGAYHNALVQAHTVGARSIAFPALSTGIYGYPLQEATEIAVKTIVDYAKANPDHFDTIDVVCFDDKTMLSYFNVVSDRLYDGPKQWEVDAHESGPSQ